MKGARFATGLFLALSGTFVLVTIYIIVRAAVYMPYLDQWGWLRRYYSDSDSLANLAFTPINGHILVVPALLYTADIVLAHASNAINLTGLVGCAIGTCLLLRAGFAALPANRSMTNLFFAASLVLMFWFHSWENLFWPFQVHGYVAAMLAAAGLFVLSAAELAGERPDVKVAIVGVALGVLATLSFGVGLSFWPAAMAMVLLGRWRPGWKLAAAGLAAGVAAPVVYWITHFSRGGQSIQRATAVDALGALKFVSLYLGSPLYFGGNERVLEQSTPALALALGAGYAGLALACLAVYRLARARRNGELTRGRMFFAGLMIFALSTAISTASARAGGALASPSLSSRYGPFCMLFWLAVAALYTPANDAIRERLNSWVAVASLGLLGLIAVSQSAYLQWWLQWRGVTARAYASLISGVPDREYLGYIFVPGRPEFVESTAATLLSQRASLLYEERSKYVGHHIGEFGSLADVCPARTLEIKPVATGVRFEGLVMAMAAPFTERKVLVTDSVGRIVGIGDVENSWRGFAAMRAEEDRVWVAYAPLDQAALGGARVYIDLGRGALCAVPR